MLEQELSLMQSNNKSLWCSKFSVYPACRIFGQPGELSLDREFGLPTDCLGCIPDDYRYSWCMGRLAALRWYAKKGKYPVNSQKKRMATAIPQLSWREIIGEPCQVPQTEFVILFQESPQPGQLNCMVPGHGKRRALATYDSEKCKTQPMGV